LGSVKSFTTDLEVVEDSKSNTRQQYAFVAL